MDVINMFVDEVIINVEAGKGGDGCTSFRREPYVSMGGPNGGNGGKGASIIFKTDKGLKTLIDLKMMKNIKGQKGENGKGQDKYGKNAEDIIIKIPCGTTITNVNTGDVLADLINDNEEYIVARGGRGGLGNKSLSNHENPAPKFSELGEPGEKVTVKCELKMLADVGLVGMPSVGKSTLINTISNANAKVGAYHFTTLNPNLGYVKLKSGKDFIMADLPGLIEGASEGIGLGHKFLRHAMRTKIIAHVIDISGSEERDPIEDYKIIRHELENYDEKLIQKEHVVILTKMDLEGSYENLELFKKEFKDEKIYPISSITKEGIDKLINDLGDLVYSIEDVKLYDDTKKESHVLYKYTNEKPFKIVKSNDIWIVTGSEIEKLFYMTRFTEEEAVERFGRKLKGMGLDDELERLGAHYGDEVRILDYQFVWKK